MDQAPSITKRTIAKLLDYTLLLAIIVGTASFFSIFFSPVQLILAILAISLLWIPFDIFCLSLFKTTPGKYLLGISLKEKLGIGKLIKASFTAAVKSLSLFIPFFNLFAAWVLIKNEPLVPCHFVQKKRRISGLMLGWILSLGIVTSTALFFELDGPSSVEIKVGERFRKKLSWVTFNDPNGSWKAEFPKSPLLRDQLLQLPSEEQSEVNLKEHFFSDQDSRIEYTITSIDIPPDLLSWGPNLVLKGSLKIVTKNIPGARVMSKKSFRYQDNPSLHYYLDQNGEEERMGRLILIDGTIYKLEVRYPKEIREEIEQELFKFVNSFSASNL